MSQHGKTKLFDADKKKILLTKESQPNQLIEQSYRRVEKRSNKKKPRKFVQKEYIQTIRRVDTKRGFNIDNTMEENG
jgi:hypothetical protein